MDYPIMNIQQSNSPECIYVSLDNLSVSVMMLYNMTENTCENCMQSIRRITGMCVVPNSDLIVLSAYKQIDIYNHQTKSKISHMFEYEVTSMVHRPRESCVAVGDMIGQIFLFFYNQDIKTKLHWHAQQVRALTFNKSGSMMLSGGEESVLVIWHLENGKKSFLPRMGSDIISISISPNEQSYAIGHSDNSISIINVSDMKVKSVTVGLKASHNNQLLYPNSCGIVHDPRTRRLVMAGTPGFIQFYDLMTDAPVMDVSLFGFFI